MIDAYGVTHPGRVRTINEDALLVDEALRLFVVAGGMGGHHAGDVASRIAVETVQAFLVRSQDQAECTWPYGIDSRVSLDANRLLTALKVANRKVFKAADASDDYTGMGTTIVAALAADDSLCFGSVGDSRLYAHGAGTLAQLTEDDSWLASIAAADPTVTEEQKATHPMRLIATSHAHRTSGGGRPTPEVGSVFRRALEARTRGAAATAWQYGRATRQAKLGSVAIVAGRGGAELRVRERGLQVGRAVLAAGRDRACARQDVKLAADVRRHRLECPESRVDARDLVRQPRVEPVDSLIDPSNHPAGRPEERNNQSQNAACNRDAVTRRHHERVYQGRRARLDVARPAASRQRRPRGPRFRRPARRRPGAERPLPGGAARGRRDAGGGPSRTRRGQCERPRRRSRGNAPSGAPDGGRLPGTARGAGAGGAGRGRRHPRRAGGGTPYRLRRRHRHDAARPGWRRPGRRPQDGRRSRGNVGAVTARGGGGHQRRRAWRCRSAASGG